MRTQEATKPSRAKLLVDEPRVIMFERSCVVLFATLNDDKVPGVTLFFEPLRRPKRRNTSEQVTKMEIIMRIMMIHVMSIKIFRQY
jgi:hypothetical protein